VLFAQAAKAAAALAVLTARRTAARSEDTGPDWHSPSAAANAAAAADDLTRTLTLTPSAFGGYSRPLHRT